MTIKIGEPSAAGEYDVAMQAPLQLLWGDGFLSPGGAGEIERLFEGGNIDGCRVPDVGAALEAMDQLLLTRHGATSVVGINVDPALLWQMDARMRQAGFADRITSRCVEPGPLPSAAASFDIVFSKDSIVQIPDKAALFAEATACSGRAGGCS